MTIKVIDISSHQDPAKINYNLFAEQADGFILRGGYGVGSPAGNWWGPDPALDIHYEELHLKRKKPVGIYHYITEYQPVLEQVDVIKQACAGKNLQMGRWCDTEYERGADKLTANTVKTYMKHADTEVGWFDLYAPHWCWKSIMGPDYAMYKHKKLWMSAYTASWEPYLTDGWDRWWLWQFTSSARVPGYDRNIDMNYFYGDRTAFDNWIGGNVLFDIKPLSQVDERWRYNKLGTSNSTIGGYGCLITSVSMMLNYFGFDTDPARLNRLLIDNGGFYNGNLFVWNSIPRFYPPVTFGYRYSYAALYKIDEQLAQNKPAIIHVDFVPTTPSVEEHWVLVVGKENGSYIINDPRDGKQLRFEDRYGDHRTKIFHVCTYNFSGEINFPQPPQEEPMLYRVRVKTGITQLVIRSGPSGSASVVFRYASGEYDIYEEKFDDTSGKLYGRIDANRWLCIDPAFVDRLAPTPTSLETRVTNLETRVTKLEQSQEVLYVSPNRRHHYF